MVRRETRRRWLTAAAVTAALLAVPTVVSRLPAPSATMDPGSLRALITGSTAQPYQGYAESSGSMAVPDLPRLGDVTALLNGTTRTRSWYAGPDRWRVATLSTAGERDVYRTPGGEFVWDYSANLLTSLIGEPTVRLPRAGDLVPPELARRVLAAAPEDPVSALPARKVAGIDAPGLRLSPADPDTMVASVDVWADPSTGLPVQVELTPRGAGRPVLVSRFLDLSLAPPPADVLVPADASGTGYTVVDSPDIADALGAFGRFRPPAQLAGRPLRTPAGAGVQGVGLYGVGLSSFVALPLPRDVGATSTDSARQGGRRRGRVRGRHRLDAHDRAGVGDDRPQAGPAGTTCSPAWCRRTC